MLRPFTQLISYGCDTTRSWRESLLLDSEAIAVFSWPLRSGSPHGILTEAVELFMDSHDHQFEDNMRAFFKFHVESLGSLLPAIMELIQRAATADAQSLLINLSQANNVVLVSILALTVFQM